MKKSILLFFAAILYATSAWAWCGNSFITVNGLWCTGSNSYKHDGGYFDGKNLGTLTTFKLGGELQVYPKSSTAASLCYKIDGGAEVAISLPKTGEEGNNSKHSGEADVDLSTLSAGNHTIAVWFKHNTDKDDNGGKNFTATFTIAAAGEEPEPVADVTVHFINTPNWAAVACHHWVEGGSGTSWPGEVLSKTDVIAGYDVYTATFTGEHTSCIFNNNNKGSQTGNLTVNDGKYYALSTDTWYDDKAAAETGLAAPIPDETIYFINNKDWTTINIYAWGGSNSDLNTWPGKPNMTKETEQIAGFDVYSLTAQKGSYKNFIINNGSSQSADFTWNDDKYYWIEGTATGDTKANAEAALAAPVVTYDYYLTGSLVGGWEPKQQGIEKDGELYKATFNALAAGTYEFKITAGDWEHQWNYNNLGAAYEEVSQGVDGEGNPNGNIKIVTEKAIDLTVIFDATANKITLEGLTEKAPEPTFDYYIAGTFNGNDPKKAENGMTLDGTVYKATVTLAAGDNMLKVTDGTWENTWGYGQLGAAYEEVFDAGEYNNIKITLAAEKEITVIFDATAGEITFEGLTPYVTPLTYTVTVPAGTEKCYIAGSMNGWAFQEMEAVTGETNKFTITIVGAKETDEYKYACQADWAYAEVIEGGGNRTEWQELDQVEEWGKPAEVKYVLMGVNGDWTNGIPLTVNPGNSSEYMLLNQPIFSATDSIKIVKLENGQAKHWCGNVENNEIKIENKVNDNIVLKDGIYDFYYKVNDDKVYIALVGYARNVTNTYGTICLPYASASTSGATFYEVVGQETGKVYLASVTSLTAGVPYIFEKNQSATQIKVVYTGDKEDAASSANGLIGTFVDETAVPANNYILYGGKLCPTDGTAKVNANRAYLDMSQVPEGAPQQMPGRRYIGMDVQGENETTGVEDIFTTDTPVKVIENGQLIIIRDGVKYNVQGQKL